MMNEVEQVRKMLNKLQIIAQVPRIHFSSQLLPVMNFIRGFLWASSLIDNTRYLEINSEVQKERGWNTNAHHFSQEMLERGFSEEQITLEVLAIEIETWTRVLADLENVSSDVDKGLTPS